MLKLDSIKPIKTKLKTKKNLNLIIAFLSGFLMALATAPISAWLLAWIALAPLWVQLTSENSKNEFPPSTRFKGKLLNINALAWGIGYHGLALSWILGIHPMDWLGVPWWPSLGIALFCWVFITLWGAALVVIWAYLFTLLNSPTLHGRWGSSPRIFTRVLIGTALWCGLESLWSSGVLWWTSLSYTQSPHNLAILHLGQLSGPNAVTAAIVAVNALIAEAWLEGTRKKLGTDCGVDLTDEFFAGNRADGFRRLGINQKRLLLYSLPLLSFLILHLIGLALYNRPLNEETNNTLKIGVIQGNIPNRIKFDSAGWRRALEGYTAGYEELATQGVDAVLIPETALPFRWTDAMQRSYLSFYQAILNRGVVAWVGGFGEEGKSITNSLFTINGAGEIVSRYDKAKLVPLGEYIPFEQWIGSLINRLSPLEAHLVAGKPNQLFDTPFGRAIVGICYDSAFAEHFRRQAAAGGEFILTASNDAHYTSAMMAQHNAQDLMRAIETDRWAVRATNTGYSAFINPRGEMIWLSGINTYEVEASAIARRQTQTLYVRWGDWLTPVLLVVGGLAWLAGKYQ